VGVFTQTRVSLQQHERAGIRQLVLGQDVRGTVMRPAAGLTHAALAAQILDQEGRYVMVVNRNQARLYEERTRCAQSWTNIAAALRSALTEARFLDRITAVHGRRLRPPICTSSNRAG
jgi:hypothetical protein